MLRQIPVELIIWTTALILLALDEPQKSHVQNHFTFCPLANLGVSWCPGCGLGRSITNLLHGNIKESIEQHWFGIPALLILLYRIWVLIRQRIGLKKGLI